MSAVAAVVLAAGASVRLGSPKQLALLGAETLLERTVRTAVEAGLDPIYGIISVNLVERAVPAGMIKVVNPQASEGMASSIRAGLQALGREAPCVAGAVILACDQPAVTSDHLRRLAQGGSQVIASTYAGRKGVPAYFPSSSFPALLALHGDVGARELLKSAGTLHLPHGDLDVDTADDLRRARELFAL